MTTRKEKLQELFENIQTVKRHMVVPYMSKVKNGITPSQMNVLHLIDNGQARTVKEIAKHLKMSSSAATQLVEGLVGNRYVVRKESDQDRRVMLLSLSKSTKTQIVSMKKNIFKRLVSVFSVLNDTEFEQYLKLSRKIVTQLPH